MDLVKRNEGFDLPGVFDLEDLAVGQKLGKNAIASYAHEWLNLCDKQSSRITILYTNVNFFNTYLDDSFIDRPLWIADYDVAAPPNVSGIDTWTFFQYTDKKWDGRQNTDSEYFNGTVAELRKFAGLVEVASSPTSSHPQLEIGSSGSVVKEVQEMVGAKPVDGIFGTVTRGAVEAFQRKHHLVVDGIVGAQTWGALLSFDNRQLVNGTVTGRSQK